MSIYMAIPKEDASLSHHGILGQKWGIRRYQNKDGSLTPEGLKRYQRFDSKSFKKEKREQYEKEGRSKLMSRVNASSAKEMAEQYDRTMHSYLKQQARIEQKMSKAKAAGDKKAYSRLVKQWIAAQSQIILADKLAKNIDSNLASYQRHQSSLITMGPIGGVIDAALPGSYFRETLKAGGKETSDQAMKDYNKRFKISNASDTKESSQKVFDATNQKEVENFLKIVSDKEAALKPGDDPQDAWDEALIEYDKRRKTKK